MNDFINPLAEIVETLQAENKKLREFIVRRIELNEDEHEQQVKYRLKMNIYIPSNIHRTEPDPIDKLKWEYDKKLTDSNIEARRMAISELTRVLTLIDKDVGNFMLFTSNAAKDTRASET